MRRQHLSAVGPAILLTATSVGAGDILTGSLAGAEAGMAVLWAVPAGVMLKWTLTEGIARWQMATGTTLLEGWVTRLWQVDSMVVPGLSVAVFSCDRRNALECVRSGWSGA